MNTKHLLCVHDGCHRYRGSETGQHCNLHHHLRQKELNIVVKKKNKYKNKICRQLGCERETLTVGYCGMHYGRLRLGKDMNAPPRGRNQPVGTVSKPDKEGYLRIKTETGWKMHHRYVMEQHIGRELTRSENVHHINGDKSDNRIDNLELWSKVQPAGKRVIDLLEYARRVIETYEPIEPKIRNDKN